VVRNAMDHGVEPAPERAAAGKSAIATLSLRARREDEHVVIEVEDDGRGVDPARIRAVAATRGIASEEALAAMNEREVVDLIFAPGFSTAAAVSELSGRGVGMDAVRAAVERIGGRALVETRVGAGTLIRFLLPFSVMVTRVLTVEAGGQTFGVPLDAVVETTLASRGDIHAIGQTRAFVFRGRTLPLIDLSSALGGGATASTEAATIVVATSAGQSWGVEVERLGERMEVILRPPEGLLGSAPAIAGTTMLGDGAVLLVLDLSELLH
jgi:two-component system chemotaxis sensor kinase CheA